MSDAAPARTQDDGTAAPRAVELFARLNAGDIRYCLWRGSFNLEGGISGETDLDIFVHPEHRAAFSSIVGRMSFKRTVPSRQMQTPDIEQFFGLDGLSGALVHLDVYSELLVGRFEDYPLRVADWLFDQTRSVNGVRAPLAETELFLLFIRINLNVSVGAIIRSIVKRVSPYPERRLREFRWLVEQTDDDLLRSRILSSGLGIDPEDVLGFLARLRMGDPRSLYVLRINRRLKRLLRDHRRGPSASELLRRAVMRTRQTRLLRSVWPIPKKSFGTRGLYVAIVGADGAGKTTLARDLTRWLGRKFAVRHLYFGIPKGSLPVWTLRKARGASARWSRRRNGSPGGNARSRGHLWRLLDRRLWLHIARHRRTLHHRASRAVARGEVVIGERFPMREFWEMREPMDGPRIDPGPGPRQRRAHIRERTIYESIDEPDLILVLDADLKTLRSRQSNLREETHAEKARVVRSLDGHPKSHVIDAGRPYDNVLLDAKQAIWRHL